MILNNVALLRNGKLVTSDVFFESDVFSIRDGLSKGVDCNGLFLLPGLRNTHVHLGSRSVSGAALGMKKYEYFDSKGFRSHKKRSSVDVYKSSLLACIELLRNGVTHVDTMDVTPEPVIKAINRVGLSYTACIAVKDAHTEAGDVDLHFKKTLSLRKKHGSSVILGLANEFECTPELIKNGLDFARENDLPIHMHAAETMDEVKHVKRLTGFRTIDFFNSIGLLDHDVRLAHCTFIDSKDVLNLSMHEVQVLHCPTSNKAISNNVPPNKLLFSNNVNVTLGTDTFAWNPSSFILGEAWKSHELTGVSVSEAYGMTHDFFTEGSPASFSLVDMSALKPFNSVNEFLSKLMNNPSAIRYVYLNGKKVVSSGKNLLKINEVSLRKDVAKIRAKLLR